MTDSNSGLSENIIAVIGYFVWPAAVVFLFIDPYKNQSFVRFHSFQSIFFAIASIIFSVAVGIVAGLTHLFFLTAISGLLILAAFILLMVKAYQGQRYELPIIGPLAAAQASK